MVYEERVEQVPYQVCRMVAEQQTIRVPHVVEKRIPVTYTYNVPRVVCYRVPLDACGNPIGGDSAAPAAPTAAGSSRRRPHRRRPLGRRREAVARAGRRRAAADRDGRGAAALEADSASEDPRAAVGDLSVEEHVTSRSAVRGRQSWQLGAVAHTLPMRSATSARSSTMPSLAHRG